jgi:hypothetical protein
MMINCRMNRIGVLTVCTVLFGFSSCGVLWGQYTKGGKACPARWKTHICEEGTILCIDPEVEMHYDLTAALTKVSCKPESTREEIPASYVRGDPFLYGFSVGYAAQPGFWMRALMLDSSMVHDGDVGHALRMLGLPFAYVESIEGVVERAISLGNNSRAAVGQLGRIPVSTEGKLACAPPSSAHACASMILFCVDPDVKEKYDLSDSETFRNAHCDARPFGNPVLATAITGDPYKAGYSLGFNILPPRFVKVVQLDDTHMAGGNLDEALKKLDLRIPSDWENEFDEGVAAGANAVIDAAHQAEEKAKQMAK